MKYTLGAQELSLKYELMTVATKKKAENSATYCVERSNFSDIIKLHYTSALARFLAIQTKILHRCMPVTTVSIWGITK